MNWKHGFGRRQDRTPTYEAWAGMRARCLRVTNKSYPRYGGRGIKVCAQWADFAAFLADMGEAPVGASLDRIDNDGNYEPGNCRWATRVEQNRNQERSHFITIDGRRQCLSAWAEERGFTTAQILSRINKLGWPPERALSAPLRNDHRRKA